MVSETALWTRKIEAAGLRHSTTAIAAAKGALAITEIKVSTVGIIFQAIVIAVLWSDYLVALIDDGGILIRNIGETNRGILKISHCCKRAVLFQAL